MNVTISKRLLVLVCAVLLSLGVSARPSEVSGSHDISQRESEQSRSMKLDGGEESEEPSPATPPRGGRDLGPASSPPAIETEQKDGPRHERQGQRVLATIPFDLEEVGFTISFHAALPHYQGLTFLETEHIEIYVDNGMSDDALRHVIAHEIGHAVNLARLSPDDESAWRLARDIEETTQWWPSSHAVGFASPAGDFAECFASYLVDSTSLSHFGSCAGTGDLVAELMVEDIEDPDSEEDEDPASTDDGEAEDDEASATDGDDDAAASDDVSTTDE